MTTDPNTFRLRETRMKIRIALASAFVICACAHGARSQSYPFQDPDLPLEHRVVDLVSRMTLDEKVSQTLYDAPAIDRLGIPAYNWWNEALHGVARAGLATVFPQPIGLAASWDSRLMFDVATVISREARAKYHRAVYQGRRGIYEGLTFWSPNINIFRDPRWGRGMETYGEDPYLTGRLAVEFVKGMQGDDPRYFRTIATPKHFAVHSGPEPDRHTFDAIVDERDLRETYLPAFRASIVEGGAQSVMCAYNRFRGDPCCGSSELLQKILRGEWRFDGYVVSDCWAIQDFYTTHHVTSSAAQSAAMAISAGTDLNCGVAFDSLGVAVRSGLVSEDLVDQAVARLFRARFRLGLFDPSERVPYAAIPYEVLDRPSHRSLALKAARESIVLLKNDGGLLPLSAKLGTVAVIGPNADDVDVLLGNYNGVPAEPVTPLAGIRRFLGQGLRVLAAKGCDLAENTPTFELIGPEALLSPDATVSGLAAEVFSGHDLEKPPALTRIDRRVDFFWMEKAPDVGVQADTFAVRWSGFLVPPVSGRYSLGLRVFGAARLFLDDTLALDHSDRHTVQVAWVAVDFRAGERRPIRIEYRDRRADAICQLVWAVPNDRLLEEAVAAASAADVAVLVLGLSPRLEGEEMPIAVPGFLGGDRVEIALPGPQEELLRAVVATGKPVVLVLLNGSALAVSWAADNVPAIVEAWYPGQAGGEAIADVLFGAYNPAGRLPVTVYRSADQLPPFSDYSMRERTYRYFTGEPLFPFGHGLSFTTFSYRSLRFPASVDAGGQLTVSVVLENTGRRAGEEVVQLYVTDLSASVPVPRRSLQGFQRVFLRPGDATTVTFRLGSRELSLISRSGARVVEPGLFEISVGGKQPGFSGLADAPTTGFVVGRLEVNGTVTAVPD